VWNCYRASCTAHGVKDGPDSLTGIQKRLEGSGPTPKEGKPLPALLSPAKAHPEAEEYLRSVHAWDAYQAGLIDLQYDPVANRVLFPINKDGAVVGYSGRGLGRTKPKWDKYGETSSLFTCGVGRIAVLVEDAASACAVGIIPEYTGASLLGTTLLPSHKVELRTYDKVLVCLDPDASMKGLRMVSLLGGTVQTSMVLIRDDLKYFDPDTIRRLLTVNQEE
jgi:hypothetical protein